MRLQHAEEILPWLERAGAQHELTVQCVPLCGHPQACPAGRGRPNRSSAASGTTDGLRLGPGETGDEIATRRLGDAEKAGSASHAAADRHALDQPGRAARGDTGLKRHEVVDHDHRRHPQEPSGEVAVGREEGACGCVRRPGCLQMPDRVARSDRPPPEPLVERFVPRLASVEVVDVVVIASRKSAEQLAHVAATARRFLRRCASVDSEPVHASSVLR